MFRFLYDCCRDLLPKPLVGELRKPGQSRKIYAEPPVAHGKSLASYGLGQPQTRMLSEAERERARAKSQYEIAVLLLRF